MIDREVARLLLALENLWPTVPVRTPDPAFQVQVWQRVLVDISLSEAEVVLIDYARSGAEFPPTAGVIAERALTMRERAAGTYPPDADQALAEVRHYTSTRGLTHGQPEHWSHPAVADVVKAIGWRELCLADNPDVMRGQFTRIYSDIRARRLAEQRRTPAMRALLRSGPATSADTPVV